MSMNNHINIKSLTINDIRRICESNHEVDDSFLEAMKYDSRSGVRQLYHRIQKRNKKTGEFKKLLEFEEKLREDGFLRIAGVDEAGRGPLAGPVVAGAVILSEISYDKKLSGLNDSKKLSENARKELALNIKKTALSWSVGMATVEEISCYNIYNASLLAMKRAVDGLYVIPDYVLVDGYNIETGIPQERVVGGDGKCASIAGASILAKVTRDELMKVMHWFYPEYGFLKHKGYGTKEHLKALEEYGASPLHRKSFTPVKKVLNI